MSRVLAVDFGTSFTGAAAGSVGGGELPRVVRLGAFGLPRARPAGDVQSRVIEGRSNG